MEIPTITTARLRLRPFCEEDVDALHNILSEKDIMRYFPRPTSPSRERVHKLIAKQLRHWETYNLGWWAVETRPGGELIGWNGLQYLPETDEVEIGYLLRHAYWGQGLTPEGGRAGLAYGFETLGLDTIIAVMHPENIASQRVAEKLGMTFTGEAVYFEMPVYRYVIEDQDFQRLQPW
jgi:ribosomal-protein-alanine N-acetyltransferase